MLASKLVYIACILTHTTPVSPHTSLHWADETA